MTTWELECEIKAKMEKETDQKEIRFLQSCLAEVLLLRSLKSHFYHTINIFGEHIIGMTELTRESRYDEETYRNLKRYLERNK